MTRTGVVVAAPTPEMWKNVSSSYIESHPARKPPYTLIELIGMAILAHDDQAPTVGEIYEWVSNKFMYYDPGETGWKNSIRHTLSIKDHFIQAGHPQPSIAGGGRTGRKSKTWKIDHRFRDHFRLEQTVEGGTTTWKVKYVPSKSPNSKAGASHRPMDVRGRGVGEMSVRKAGSKARKSASLANKPMLETVHEADSGPGPSLMTAVTAQTYPSMSPLSPLSPTGAAIGVGMGHHQTYLYRGAPGTPEEDERELMAFPSVEEVNRADIYDDHDDQTLVYLPRYDKRPRRKASLAACDVLTSLSTRIQSTYQIQ